MGLRSLLLIVVIGLLSQVADAAGWVFRYLGDGSIIKDVSGDGKRFVGTTGYPYEAAYWTPSRGWVPLSLPGWTWPIATGASYDGRVIVGHGNIGSSSRTFRWEDGVGVTDIGVAAGTTGTRALAVSANGQVVVGYSLLPSGYAAPFRWSSATGFTILTGLPGGIGRGEALAASGDGSAVVGYELDSSFRRMGFRWTQATGVQPLTSTGPPDYLEWEEARAISLDGQIVFGGYPALRWRAGIGSDVLEWGYSEPVNSCSAAGQVAIMSMDEPDINQYVYLWRPGVGVEYLQNYLRSNGATVDSRYELSTGVVDDSFSSLGGTAIVDDQWGWFAGGWAASYISTSAPPTATEDYYRQTPNTHLEVPAPGVLANDLDPVGFGLRAIRVSGPSRGQLFLYDDGSFRYEPEGDTFGTETFTYRVTDGINTSAPVTVVLDVRFRAYRYTAFPGVLLSDVENHGIAVGGRQIGGNWEPFGPVPAGFNLGGGSTFIEAINNFGDMAGWGKVANGDTRGFVRKGTTTTVLPTLGGSFSAAYDVNDSGLVVGESSLPSGRLHATMWINGVLQVIPVSGDSSRATGVSAAGTVVGVRTVGGIVSAWTWNSTLGTRYLSQTWEESWAEAVELNGAETISGAKRGADGRLHATTWNAATLAFETLPTPAGSDSFANDRGRGWFEVSGNRLPWPLIDAADVVTSETSPPYGGMLRSIERLSGSMFYSVVRTERVGGLESLVLAKRVPEEWERTRGIGEVTMSAPVVEGGIATTMNYRGDPSETIMLQVISGNPSLLEFSQNQQGMGLTTVTIRTREVEQETPLQIRIVPSFSYEPQPVSLTLVPRRAQMSGHVELQDFVAAPAGQVVSFEILVGQLVAWSTTTVLDGDGDFSIPWPPELLESYYQVRVKGTHWLARVTGPVLIDALGVSGLSFTLINGDCDMDNEVGIGDYSIVSSSYGGTYGEQHFLSAADLNGDDTVDIADYAILSSRYGMIGD